MMMPQPPFVAERPAHPTEAPTEPWRGLFGAESGDRADKPRKPGLPPMRLPVSFS